MLQRIVFLTGVICALLSGAAPAEAKKLALVIGINSYPNFTWANSQLQKAVTDARGVEKKLRDELRFDKVELITDQTALKPTLSDIQFAWRALLAHVGPGDTLLFYFAGHGVEFEGQNFLLTRDATFVPHDSAGTKAKALDLQQLFQDLAAKQSDVAPDSIGIFVIDACRENPKVLKPAPTDSAAAPTTEEYVAHGRGGSVIGAGLAPIIPPGEIFVMYSAGIGQTASDEGGPDHSPFAHVFLDLLPQEMPLSALGQSLQYAVYKKAQPHTQTPAYYNQLRRSRTVTGEKADPETFAKNDTNESFTKNARFGHRDTVQECNYCPEMVVLRSEETRVGSADTDTLASATEKPITSVALKRFAIGKYEVTVREWNRCVLEDGCKGHRPVVNDADGLKPVINISWDEAQTFAKWLSKISGKSYRLPTEAEWEYAARAGSAGRYTFTDNDRGGPISLATKRLLCKYGNGADRSTGVMAGVNTACEDGFGREVAPRGSYLPNAWGLFDMMGNAWEWVEDCWHPNHIGAPANGTAWTTANSGDCSNRVARGGSWRSGPEALRTAARHYFPQGHRRATLGFRVVREVSEAE
jgi:formylglycine-generating enzyme required for sulfatase activity